MNIKKSIESYKFIILIIIIVIILLALIYYKVFKDTQNIEDSFVDYSKYSKSIILDDCKNGYGKEYKENNPSNTQEVNDFCMSNAYLTDPKLLCGICGTEDNPLFSMESTSYRGRKYYGCRKDSLNAISLNWGDQGTQINKLLSDRLTCDTLNQNAISGMYIYLACDGESTILVNDKVVQNHTGINLGGYYIDNLEYGDKLVIQCKQSGQSFLSKCGICISYIWNKQIYILDNNGYQNCANTMYYRSDGFTKWDNIWAQNSIGLLPWMKNWIRGMDGTNSIVSIETYIGSTKNTGLMNNDCVIFGSATYDGDNSYISQDASTLSASILLNYVQPSKLLYINTNYKKKFTNKYYEYKIKNVMEGNIFGLGGTYNNGSNTKILDFTTSYIWCGKIFSTPQDNNFNKITEQIILKSAYTNNIVEYNLINRNMSDNKFLYYEKQKINPKNSNESIMYYTINNKIATVNTTNFFNTLQQLILKSI